MYPDLKSIILNVFGGLIVSFLTWAVIRLYDRLNSIKFKKLFGGTSLELIKLVYGRMVLQTCYDENRTIRTHPYTKKGNSMGYRVSSILSDTEAVSMKYLSDAFSKNTKKSPELTSDDDLTEKINLSFISLGGLNNWKSIDVLDSEENIFFKFASNDTGHVDRIVSVKDIAEFYRITRTTDFGLIIKTRPKQFPSQVHFCVAGIDEAGTRGAAYFLSTKWEEILKKTKGREFGAIISVKNGSDESAELIRCVPKPENSYLKKLLQRLVKTFKWKSQN
ncbi:MAG: hypothetical protein JXQ26_07100 [Tissierellales bacterium]|nr:hypothetical protein [Tissierellales bacterium]